MARQRSRRGRTGAGGRTYNAENRMTSSALGYGIVPDTTFLNEYVSDAAGKRVRRKVQSGQVWHVYGFDGELITEYAAAGEPSQPQKEYGYRAGGMLVIAAAGGQVQ